jgi:exodeoxyribonuclease VII small subunit
MAKKIPEKPDFEASLKALETLVETMEKGDLSLEDSLSHFERGVQLSRTCQQALKEAEQKVEILMQKSGQDDIAPFDSEISSVHGTVPGTP